MIGVEGANRPYTNTFNNFIYLDASFQFSNE